MRKIYIHENIQGKELKELLWFVGRTSDKMSLARYYDGKLTQEEFNKMQLEYKSLILEKDKKNRKRYKKNINGYRDSINDFCGTTMSAEEYFNHHLELDIENCNSLDYEEFKNGKYQTFNGRVEDFLYVKFTRDTPVTSGPVFEMCYFIINDIFKKLMSNINRLFEYPHYIEDIEFEDLTFYKGERIVLAICAHEQFAYLNLDYEEYKELVKLNISHEVEE